MKKKAIILGAGPAGLAAAEACHSQRIEVAGIFSAPIQDPRQAPIGGPLASSVQKSTMHGAQFLHGPMYGSRVKHSEPITVRYKLDGSPDDYRAKVYGGASQVKVSAEKYRDGHEMPGWDIRAAYDQLWAMWQGWMTPVTVTPAFLKGVINEADGQAHILSTVPRDKLCVAPEEHTYACQRIYAVGDSETFSLKTPSDTIWMSGSPDHAWYRASTIYGHTTVEWPGGRKPPIEGVVSVRKPLWTNCKCWQGLPINFLGRYGEWKKSVLVHDVYDQAQDIAAGMRVARV